MGHFTVDNASNNETMLQELERLLLARDIPFNATDRKIMCYGHIVDLSSGRVIRALSHQTNDEQFNSDSKDDSPPALHPILHARKVVHVIRASGMRRDAFEEVIVNGNAKGWFKIGNNTIQVKKVQLLRDVKTRWDSEYLMLNRLRELRPVCHLLLNHCH